VTKRVAVVAVASMLVGCVPGLPGVEGVRGTSPAPATPWAPPPAPVPVRTPAIAAVPADLAARMAQLTLADVLDLALRNSSATRVAWADARSAASAYGATLGAYYPSITGSANVTRLKTVPSQGRQAVEQTIYGPTANLSWLLLDFGGRSGTIDEARQSLLAADWTHNATIQNVVLEVESAYFQYLATRALLAAQRTTVSEAEANLAAAEERREVGVATIADVLQARTALAQAQLALETTEGQLATTRGALALSMGLPANVPYDIEPAREEEHPPLSIVEGVDSLIDRAVAARPDLAAARAEASAADARIRKARGDALPSIVTTGSVGRTYIANSTAGGSSYTMGIGLSIPLFEGFALRYTVRAAQAAADAARAQLQGLEQQVAYQVFASYYGLKTATQRERTSAALLASAEESEQVALGQYKEGVGSVLDLLTAQSALADARAQQIDARWSWYIALAQLAHDIGILGVDGSAPLHFTADTTGSPP
jgi:outer membrane protein